MRDYLAEATAALQAAIPEAEADPRRPVFHFRPPAQWTNDPNGTIYYEGYYHLFYQHNPFAPEWGPMFWGHARSRNLVYWEHLPLALAPSLDKNETHCFSGCVAVNGQNEALAIYTSVSMQKEAAERTRYTRPFEQWAAVSTDWLHWDKYAGNPVLAPPPGFREDWRDPFIFRLAARTFLVVGMCGPGTALYEAQDDTLKRWTFRGLISDVSAECPNFFPLEDRFVFLYSPFSAVEYQIGTFNAEDLQYTPEQQGYLDPGYHNGNGFYASNVLFDATGRCILFGWLNGCGGPAWRGVISLPRELSLGSDGGLRQLPAKELQQLRGAFENVPGIWLNHEARELPNPASNNIEILLRFFRYDSPTCGLKLCWEGHEALICFDGEKFYAAGVEGPFVLQPNEPLLLQIFCDRCVLEIFVNEGRTCISRCIEAGTEPVRIEAFAEGKAHLEAQIYAIKPIWQGHP